MLIGAMDGLNLVARGHMVDRAAPVAAGVGGIGPPVPLTALRVCALARAGAAKLEWLDLDLGLWHRHAVVCGLHRVSEGCHRGVGYEGRTEQRRKGPPHDES